MCLIPIAPAIKDPRCGGDRLHPIEIKKKFSPQVRHDFGPFSDVDACGPRTVDRQPRRNDDLHAGGMAKTNRGGKQRKRASANDGDKRKSQAVVAGEKRMKTMKGRNVKARLAELTAELDIRTAEVQDAYTKVRHNIRRRYLSLKPGTCPDRSTATARPYRVHRERCPGRQPR